jgi:hypothetical protein
MTRFRRPGWSLTPSSLEDIRRGPADTGFFRPGAVTSTRDVFDPRAFTALADCYRG